MPGTVDLLCLRRAEGERVRFWLEPDVAFTFGHRRWLNFHIHRCGDDWKPCVTVHGAGGHYEAAVTCEHVLPGRDDACWLLVPRAMERREDGRPERVLLDLVAIHPTTAMEA